MKKHECVTIGDLAKATDTKAVTIRYYEQAGLLPAPPRTASNYRAYGHGHLARLRFIRRCRELGFTLDQVRDLLRLSSREDYACTDVDRITAEHLSAIETKVADLRRLAGELRRIASRCPGNGRIADCRIIDALSPGAMGAKTPGVLGQARRIAGRGSSRQTLR
jgi:DNA-binding transcriptional MerR regulator